MARGFDGKVAVITGAGAGIGKALALKLAKAGAEVWALDLNTDALAELSDEAGKTGLNVTTRGVNVVDRDGLIAVRDEIKNRHQRLDLWINNAGIAKLGEFMEGSLTDFDQVVAVNLTGVVNGTRVALEAMETAGFGRIVNMASMAGHLPAPYMTAYVASKHAVVGFTRSLSEELRLKSSPVSLLLVSPGFVDTQIIAKGAKMGFPEWLSFMLSKPEAVADDILRAVSAGKKEIYPTLNGKVLKRMYWMLPKTTVGSSKILLTKTWKDLVFNRYTR